jgi:hypothetical protein
VNSNVAPNERSFPSRQIFKSLAVELAPTYPNDIGGCFVAGVGPDMTAGLDTLAQSCSLRLPKRRLPKRRPAGAQSATAAHLQIVMGKNWNQT